MLILTRQPGQIIAIQPREDLLPGTPVVRLFGDGPIEILVTRVRGNQVCLGIQAHPDLLVNRGERKMQGS
jgi:sRNA-binding carbon storage regulator CsrA